jgi:hypothetical protein
VASDSANWTDQQWISPFGFEVAGILWIDWSLASFGVNNPDF